MNSDIRRLKAEGWRLVERKLTPDGLATSAGVGGRVACRFLFVPLLRSEQSPLRVYVKTAENNISMAGLLTLVGICFEASLSTLDLKEGLIHTIPGDCETIRVKAKTRKAA